VTDEYCSALPSGAEQGERVGGVEDVDVAERAEIQEVTIAGQEQGSFRGERRGEDMVVVGIARDARQLDGLDQLDGFEVVGQYCAWASANDGQPLRGSRSCQNVGKLLQKERAAEKLGRLVRAQGAQEPVRRTAPQKRGDHNVGVRPAPAFTNVVVGLGCAGRQQG
jgi:hypothetical protein